MKAYYIRTVGVVVWGLLVFLPVSSLQAGTWVMSSNDTCEVSGRILKVDYKDAPYVDPGIEVSRSVGAGAEPTHVDRFAVVIAVNKSKLVKKSDTAERVPCNEAYPVNAESTIYIYSSNVTDEEQLYQSEGKYISGVVTQNYKNFDEYEITDAEPKNWLQRFFDWIKSLFDF